MNEFDRIATYFAPLSAPAGLGLKDDAALMDLPPGVELVVTKDAIVQGVHFMGDEPPGLIAQKLLRTNLSDLAAMGAQPLYYLLAVMAPQSCDDGWLGAFAAGLKADQEAFGIRLIGGDSTTSPHLCLSLTAFGTVPQGQALTRRGARVGEGVFVSGTVGDGLLGLHLAQGKPFALSEAEKAFALTRYRLPTPRLQLGKQLRGLAGSAIDVSDGLMQDAEHVARASGVGLRIDAQRLPRSDAVKHAGLAIEACATAGDDYELLFTAPKNAKVDATLIGEVVEGEGALLIAQGKEVPLATTGYRHA